MHLRNLINVLFYQCIILFKDMPHATRKELLILYLFFAGLIPDEATAMSQAAPPNAVAGLMSGMPGLVNPVST